MFAGSLVAIVTPMRSDGAVDFEAWARLLELHAEQGTHGVVIGGTTGERWSWSITCVLVDPHESPRIGWTGTREEAQQQLAEAWRTWLKRTNLQEI